MRLIKKDKVIYKYTSNMEPEAIIAPHDIFGVETNDCFSQQILSEEQILSEIDYSRLNPATGPIYVESAEPGDILKVEIINIEVKERGIAAVVPDEGVLGDQVTKPVIKVIGMENSCAVFHGIRLPISPMIGVIGVAPSYDDGEWATDSPWRHGGNMDTKAIKAGSSVYFNVNQKGALLALGDCHAIMGDGEVCFTGLEVPAIVTLKTDIIKDKQIEWPIVETLKEIIIIVSGNSLDEAVYGATDQAVRHIQNSLGISWEDAYIMASLTVDIRISQLVDPKITVRATIPKYVVSMERLIDSI